MTLLAHMRVSTGPGPGGGFASADMSPALPAPPPPHVPQFALLPDDAVGMDLERKDFGRSSWRQPWPGSRAFADRAVFTLALRAAGEQAAAVPAGAPFLPSASSPYGEWASCARYNSVCVPMLQGCG